MSASFCQSNDGTHVPVINGKSLESLNQPMRDAKRWVERETDKILNFENVAVMGLGSGAYIIELAQTFPEKQFFVFECLDRDESAPQIKLPKNVTLIPCQSIDDVLGADSAKSLLKKPFRILRHPGAYRFFSGFFDEVIQFLTGRSKAGFKWNIQQRPSQAKFFRQWDKYLNGEMISGRPITVVDVGRFATTHANQGGYEFSIWSSLRELVK